MGVMSDAQTAYVVTSGHYSDYEVRRVYLDQDEAQRWVDAYNATSPDYDCQIEEYPIGKPRADYDGPLWRGYWSCNRVEKPGQRSGGYFEHFQPVEFIDEWVDRFRIQETWHTGAAPGRARVVQTNANSNWPSATVEGTSREHVEKVLQDTAAQVKAQRIGIT
jgi:hypothetical protein